MTTHVNMSNRTKYTPVARSLSGRNEQTEDCPSLSTPSLAPVSNSLEIQDTFLLEDIAPRLSPDRYDSTEALHKTKPQNQHVQPTTRPISQKPPFLKPTMWMYEIISLAIAVFILGAITTVLALYDSKPSPVVGGITLNTMVAFAATIFRICLMVPATECVCQLTWVWLAKGYKPLNDVFNIDMASRGPLASLQLLMKFAHGPLLGIGASVIIISIVIGPLFQQTVSFYSASVALARNEGIAAYASVALTYKGNVGNVGETIHGYGASIPFNLKAAMNTGLYSAGVSGRPDPPYSCPSGNCTWTAFPTLAVSAQCFDQKERYHLNCSDPTLKPWPGYNFTACALEAKDPADRSSHLLSQYKVFESNSRLQPGPMSAAGPIFGNLSFDYGFSQSFESPETTKTSLNPVFGVFEWQAARNLTWEFGDSSRNSSITPSSTFEAGMCIFYMSMEVISARVQNGVYSESTVYRTTKVEPGNYSPSDPPSRTNLTFTWTRSCNTLFENEICSIEGLENIQLNINSRTYSNIIAAIVESLPDGNLTVFLQSGLHKKGSNTNAAESLYRSPNITRTMHTIAHYATVALRANDTTLAHQNDPHNTGIPANFVAPSHRIPGVVYVQTVHLRVRWGWLALPASLALIVAGLLFETIRQSRPEIVGVWKNNAMAVLLNTEWRPERDQMGAATSDELEKLAEGLEARVVLGESDGIEAKRMVIIRERINREAVESSWQWLGMRQRVKGKKVVQKT